MRYALARLSVEGRFRFRQTLTSGRLYQALHFDFTALFAVCIHGSGATVDVLSSP